MKRSTFFAVLFLLFSSVVLHAQQGPVAGKTYTVVYNPASGSALADASSLSLFYVFDFWNKRYGTRLALWQNVVYADTSRLHVTPLRRGADGWKADIPIPVDAALLSYVISDGSRVDGNNQKTFVRYILNENGAPVMNARFFNIPFMKLAREESGALIKEAEREIVDYPENFLAYNQYFTLLLEKAKGNPRTQQRISDRLDGLEQRYGSDDDFLNLAAETWYYVLQDHDRAMDYRNRITPSEMWPQVFKMFNREEKTDGDRQRLTYNESRRSELRGNELPSFNLLDADGAKAAFPKNMGKPAVYVFWASVSEKSCNLLLALRGTLSDFPADAIDVIAVNLDIEQEKGQAWYHEQDIPFTLMFNQGNLLIQLGVDSIPIAYFVDESNVVREIVVGYSQAQQPALRSALELIAP